MAKLDEANGTAQSTSSPPRAQTRNGIGPLATFLQNSPLISGLGNAYTLYNVGFPSERYFRTGSALTVR
jgi:hypothetical protein